MVEWAGMAGELVARPPVFRRSLMNLTTASTDFLCALESTIATAELDRRPSRQADRDAESRALLSLTHELARSPDCFFARLVESALELSGADSTGISLLNQEEGRFVWPAVAGILDCYIGGGTPSDFGPCGTVLDRQATVLFLHPERHFTYLAPIQPPLEEVLLIPFYMNGLAVGTLWAVIHEPGRKFDAEDRRLLESLSTFAASAYRTLASNGTLEPLMRVNAV
jgi:GAF domain-containing protein